MQFCGELYAPDNGRTFNGHCDECYSLGVHQLGSKLAECFSGCFCSPITAFVRFQDCLWISLGYILLVYEKLNLKGGMAAQGIWGCKGVMIAQGIWAWEVQGAVVYVDRFHNEEQAVDACLYRMERYSVVACTNMPFTGSLCLYQCVTSTWTYKEFYILFAYVFSGKLLQYVHNTCRVNTSPPNSLSSI